MGLTVSEDESWQRTWQQADRHGTEAETENLHLPYNHKTDREVQREPYQEMTGLKANTQNGKLPLQRLISFNKATHSNLSQIIPPIEDKAVSHRSLWGYSQSNLHNN